MGNMSYCRFQNTLSDLRDCKEALDEAGDLDALVSEVSEEEARAAKKLVQVCREIVAEYGAD